MIEGDYSGVYSIDLNANGKVDYIYATSKDGRIIRINTENYGFTEILHGAGHFYFAPTVSGGPGNMPWIFAVSGNYETAERGRVYAIRDDFTGESVDAQNIPKGRGWNVNLPAGSYPMPWSKIEVFYGRLYVPVVSVNVEVPFCALCLDAMTRVYSIENGTLQRIHRGTLSPQLSLKKLSGEGFNTEVTGSIYSVGVRNLKKIKSENVPSPSRLWEYKGAIYKKKPGKR